MILYSTNKKSEEVSLKQAVLQGLADDGGLFMPTEIPSLPKAFFDTIEKKSFLDNALTVANALIGKDVPEDALSDIIKGAFSFDIPLAPITDTISVLELFHGPTLSFKDFGARFMARLLSYFVKDGKQKITILVATSGDTGSAVGNGFLGVEGIDVIILYPSGKVSESQEKQLTTLGQNVTALEIKGTFDDCQRMVKIAFNDKELNKKMKLTSANSINIARLIPQTFYYFYAYSKVKSKSKDIYISVPCGNFGNLTAGLIAKRMGLPIKKFIASCNANDTVTNYLLKGIFKPKDTVKTISNAMDVGNPSNFIRMLELYDHDVERMREDIKGYSFSDDETKQAIKEIFRNHDYIMDPHGAVGYLGLKQLLNSINGVGVFLETSHPAKFAGIVEEVIGGKVEMPEALEQFLKRDKKSIVLEASFEKFKEYLIKR